MRTHRVNALLAACGLATGIPMLGCSGGDFTGSSAGRPSSAADTADALPSDNVVDVDADKNDAPFIVKDGNVTLRFAPGKGRREEGETVTQPLAIYFALDITNSMQPMLDTIKNSVVAFGEKLRESGFEPSLGVIAYRDDIEQTLPLTSDLDAFRSFVSSQSAAGGGDDNEAALLAVKTAVAKMQSEADEDAVKAVLVITDNPGHSGGARFGTWYRSPSECDVGPLVQTLNALDPEQQALLKIYHSTGTVNGARQRECGAFATAYDQWSAVLSSALKVVDESSRGGGLAYPFTDDVLLNDFVDLLETTTPDVDRICLASEATLFQDGIELNTWQPPEAAEVYAAFKAKTPLEWKNAIGRDDLAAALGEQLRLKVRSCCYDREDASKGDFSTCREVQAQEVDFKLDVK